MSDTSDTIFATLGVVFVVLMTVAICGYMLHDLHKAKVELRRTQAERQEKRLERLETAIRRIDSDAVLTDTKLKHIALLIEQQAGIPSPHFHREESADAE